MLSEMDKEVMNINGTDLKSENKIRLMWIA